MRDEPRMRYLATLLLTAFFLSLFPAVPSMANTPPEVLKYYKIYQAALDSNDEERALLAAKRAYETSEKLMGNSATTGMLAHNYANLLRADDPDAAISLFEQAIKLNPGDSDAEVSLNAERHILIGQTWVRRKDFSRSDVVKMKADFRASSKFMRNHGLVNTTFGAESLVLDAIRLSLDKDYDAAIENLDQALAIFDSPAHTFVSMLRHEAYVLKGDILTRADQPIDAALSYQFVMQNLEGDLPSDHPFIENAFHKWMFSRGMITQKNIDAEALDAGVCKCWPYDEMSANAPLPKLRVPPIMPKRARRSGHVRVLFDINRNGEPYNIRATTATNTMFIEPSIRSVKKWEYEIGDDLKDEDLKGIVTKISFRLTDQRGRVISDEAPKIIKPE